MALEIGHLAAEGIQLSEKAGGWEKAEVVEWREVQEMEVQTVFVNAAEQVEIELLVVRLAAAAVVPAELVYAAALLASDAVSGIVLC